MTSPSRNSDPPRGSRLRNPSRFGQDSNTRSQTSQSYHLVWGADEASPNPCQVSQVSDLVIRITGVYDRKKRKDKDEQKKDKRNYKKGGRGLKDQIGSYRLDVA
jgi:hypothetical protein